MRGAQANDTAPTLFIFMQDNTIHAAPTTCVLRGCQKTDLRADQTQRQAMLHDRIGTRRAGLRRFAESREPSGGAYLVLN
ncbi:hypothetical protein AB1N83_006093 [Pleurotus pulmonarius]